MNVLLYARSIGMQWYLLSTASCRAQSNLDIGVYTTSGA